MFVVVVVLWAILLVFLVSAGTAGVEGFVDTAGATQPAVAEEELTGLKRRLYAMTKVQLLDVNREVKLAINKVEETERELETQVNSIP